MMIIFCHRASPMCFRVLLLHVALRGNAGVVAHQHSRGHSFSFGLGGLKSIKSTHGFPFDPSRFQTMLLAMSNRVIDTKHHRDEVNKL